MSSTGPWKHFAVAFVIALVMYGVFYWGIEYLRTRKGPWVMDFAQDASGAATITINQSTLGVANVRLSFTNRPAVATNAQVAFAVPKEVPYQVPFGRCIFIDTTFQPGTIAFDFFGHEVQLMPYTLTVDHQSMPWQSGAVIMVTNAPVLLAQTNRITNPK